MSPEEARTDIQSGTLHEFKKNLRSDTCCVRNCRGKAGNTKKKRGEHWYCSRHWQQLWRWENPKNAAYRALKDHACGRGLEFRISWEYFLGMMDVAAAWDHQAESRGDLLSFDRIDPTKGYVQGNVRIITISQNSAKGAREKFLPEMVQALLDRKRQKMKFKIGEDEVPECDPF